MFGGGREWVVASAREVRAAVRAQLAEQMAGRQKAALSVASAYAKVEKARQRLAAAEQEASAALATATETVPLADLVSLAGVPATELRRLSKGARQEPTDGAAHTGVAPTAGPAAAATTTVPVQASEPVPAG